MKKTYLLAALSSSLATVPILAANYDLYLTGSTAFRPQVFSASSKIFDGGTPAHAINSSGAAPGSGDNNWAMSGSCTNVGINSPDTLTIHGFFTGSVQGLHAVANNDFLGFVGNATASTIVSNYASIAFSDVNSKYTIVPLNLANFTEVQVAVQPFVFVKSLAPSGVAKIQNITFQEIQGMYSSSTETLAYFTGDIADDFGTTVTLLHRSLDSGTRVATVQECKLSGKINALYFYNHAGLNFTNAGFQSPTLYGVGYSSGGNLRTALQFADAANQSIGYLSLADAQTISTTNWSNILKYNGLYPVANWTPANAPTGSSGQTGSSITTNDFTPVVTGQYSFWAYEVLAVPSSSQWNSQLGQDLSYSQLTSIVNRLTGTYTGIALPGSIDYEIELSKTIPPYATAIRLNDMDASRQAVGGIISF